MAHTVTLKGGPCDGKTLRLAEGRAIHFPYVADGKGSECRIGKATYSAETNWNAVLSD